MAKQVKKDSPPSENEDGTQSAGIREVVETPSAPSGNGGASLAALLIISSLAGLVLEQQNKLKPLIGIVLAPNPATTGANPVSLSKFVVALIIYLVVLNFLDSQQGLELTLVLLLGAVMFNYDSKGKDSIFATVFGG